MVRARAISHTDPTILAGEYKRPYYAFLGNPKCCITVSVLQAFLGRDVAFLHPGSSTYNHQIGEYRRSCTSRLLLTQEYGNGAWPLLTAYERGEIAANGNYLESDTISVRHGICGDPEQVRTILSRPYKTIPHMCLLNWFTHSRANWIPYGGYTTLVVAGRVP